MQHSIYLAGPITGYNFGEVNDWREIAKERLEASGIKCYSPLRGKAIQGIIDQEIIQGSYEGTAIASAKGIMGRDRFDCTRVDAVLMNLAGAKHVSIGTMIEIGWADLSRRPIIIIMEKDNIHQHPMVTEAATYIVHDLENAMELVELLFDVEKEEYGEVKITNSSSPREIAQAMRRELARKGNA